MQESPEEGSGTHWPMLLSDDLATNPAVCFAVHLALAAACSHQAINHTSIPFLTKWSPIGLRATMASKERRMRSATSDRLKAAASA